MHERTFEQGITRMFSMVFTLRCIVNLNVWNEDI